MDKLKLYRAFFAIPILLVLSGVLFLVLVSHWVFELMLSAGIAISAAIVVFAAFFVHKNRLIMKNLVKQEKSRGRDIIPHHSVALLSIIAIFVLSFYSGLTIASFHYDTGPVLTWNTYQDPATGITVLWRTKAPISSVVYYSTDAANLNLKAELDKKVEMHMVELNGLIPNTKYYYRVGGQPETAVYSFTTAPIGDSDFTFLIFSDPRQNSGQFSLPFLVNMPQAMAKTMEAQGITQAFTICCGDITGEAQNTVTWKSWFDDLTKSGIGSKAAVQVAIGNHERHGNNDGKIFGEYYPYEYRPYYYYSFNYSSVHVTVLDPWNEESGWGKIDDAQIAWLDQDLNNSAGMKYKIVALHPPPVSGSTPRDDLKAAVELFDKYGVDAVFFGHDHDFAISKINSTNYFLIGVGGNLGEVPTGFVQADVTSAQLNLVMHWSNGTVQKLVTISA
jgi:hypothetical protein